MSSLETSKEGSSDLPSFELESLRIQHHRQLVDSGISAKVVAARQYDTDEFFIDPKEEGLRYGVRSYGKLLCVTIDSPSKPAQQNLIVAIRYETGLLTNPGRFTDSDSQLVASMIDELGQASQ